MKRQLKVRVAFGVLLAAFVSAAGMLLRAEPPQAVGTWASLGTTPESRVGAAAVALPDGRTLIVGGSIAGAPTDSVVVFDPADGSFASAGHLLLPRVGHTATLLDDGRVLIAGGTAGDLLSADLELFDPSSGSSVLGGSMAQPRTGHAASKLADGKVLIAGGTGTDGVLQSAEIYDPTTGATTPTTLPMLVARTGASATTLIDGRVLIAGGNSGTGTPDLASAELFEASSQIFEAATTSLSVPRSGHTAVLLPWNNSVLIAGGSSNGVAQTTSDLFLPAEFPDPYSYGMGSFAPTGSLIAPRSGAVASPHIEGYAVAIGGSAPEAEVYRFATIKTDKDDYAPGTKAIITGSGWEPNADVTLVFQEDPAVHDDYILHVTSKSDGTIYWDQWAPEEHDLNVRFYLMATDSKSRAQTTFTDSRTINSVTLNGGSTVTVTAGASINAAVTVTTTGSGSNTRWRSTGWRIDAAAPGTVTCVDHSNHDANGTFLETFSINAPTAASTYNAYFVAYDNDSCTGIGGETIFTMTGAVTVNPGPLSAFAVTNTSDGNIPTQTAGTPFNIKVRAVDAFSNTVTGFNGGSNKVMISSTGTLSAGSGATAGFTNGVLASHSVTISNSGTFTITATRNPSGPETGTSNSFLVNPPACTNPVVTGPTNQTVTYGNNAVFTASATGTPVPTLQWQVSTNGGGSWSPIGGATTSPLTITAPTVSQTGTQYRAVFTNTCGTVNSAAATLTVNKATATVIVTPYTVTYDGSPHTATVTSITGVNGQTGATVGSVTLSTTHTNAGTYSSDSWSFTGTANYNNIAATTITDTINKATATVVVTPYSVTYDGSAHSATVTSITGVNGETGATVGTVTLNTTHTSAGTYSTDTWSFTGAGNYNNIASTTITDTINKATATVVVTPYSVTYDGSAHSATVTSITGVNGETGATVGTVTLNTTHTSAGTYSTDTWSFTGAGNYNNIASTTITDTINKATATVVVTPYSVTYDGSAHSATVTSITGVNGETGATVGTVTLNTTHTSAGTYSTDTWSFTGAGNYNNIASTTITDTINKATATVVVTPYSVTYDGSAHSATVTSITGVNGETGATVGSVTLNTTHTPAGTYSTDSWSFTGAANYNDIASTTITDTINKATATVVVTPYSVTYDGSAHSATVASITGVNGETGATVGTVDVSGTTHTAAATYNGDVWTFTGAANYNNTSGTVDDAIAKANAVVVVTPYSVTYDGSAHTATVASITGVNSETGATVGTVDVSGTTHTAAATYNGDVWTFTGATNYNNTSGTVDDAIAKANAVVVVTPYSVTYDGSAHTATVASITGVNSETGATVGTVDVSGTTHTAAGPYNGDVWSFTGTANYNNTSGTVDDAIAKANAVVVVTPYSVTYDGSAHSATVTSITGVNGETGATVGSVTLNTTHTPAGTYSTDSWSFTGAANYNDIASTTITDTINKATATVVVTPYSVTYDGSAHSATVASITGVNSETGATVGTVDVSGTTHTAAATYNGDVWTFTGATNYNNTSGTVDDAIAKANAVVVVTPYSVTYDGSAHTATVASITGVNSETGATVGTVDVSGTTHTAAGPYNGDVWSFTGTANYNNTSGTVDDAIAKANAVVVVTPYSVTYDGGAHTATVASITGVNSETGATVGTVDVSGTTHTAAGPYNGDVWSFTGTANYNNTSGTVDDAIAKANAVVVVTPYSVTYDGGAHTATVASITGVNSETGATVGTVDVSGTTHTAAATYNGDVWTFTGAANYNNTSGTVDDAIAKANAVVVVTPYSVTYNGSAHTATVASITGVNSETGATVGTVDVSGTTHTAAATYNGDLWTFTGAANYNNTSGTVDDAIAKANAVVVVTSYSVTYNGSAHTATVTSITGVNGETGATVGSVTLSTTHTAAGTYSSDSWSFAGAGNYNDIASTTITDTIARADATVVVTPYSVNYNGLAHSATYTISGVNGEAGVTVGTVNVTNTTHTGAGTYGTDTWSFTGAGNYNNIAATTITDTINKANATFTVSPYDVTYDGSPHTATYTTITGVNGETGATVGAVTLNTTHTNAGTYAGDTWSFAGTANYNSIASTTITDKIAKANATIAVTPYSVSYDLAPHTATGAATGVGSANLIAQLTVGGTTHTNPGDYLSDPWSFAGGTNYNDATGTVHDRITYATGLCLGASGHQILQPISASLTNPSIVKRNSTVPAKFRVCDVSGHSIGTPGVVSSFGITGMVGGAIGETIPDLLSTTPDTAFRWDSTDQQWIFNISTKTLTAGYTYEFTIGLNDGTTIVFKLGVK